MLPLIAIYTQRAEVFFLNDYDQAEQEPYLGSSSFPSLIKHISYFSSAFNAIAFTSSQSEPIDPIFCVRVI